MKTYRIYGNDRDLESESCIVGEAVLRTISFLQSGLVSVWMYVDILSNLTKELPY